MAMLRIQEVIRSDRRVRREADPKLVERIYGKSPVLFESKKGLL
jgi:hypothetical protein